jgi:serine protease
MNRFLRQYSVGFSGFLIVTLLIALSVNLVFAQDSADPDATNKRVFLPMISSGDTTASGLSPDSTDQIIVRYYDSAQAASADQDAQMEALSEAAGVDVSFVREMSGDAIVVKLAEPMSAEDVAEIADLMLAVPDVEYTEPDLRMQTMLAPNDPRYPEQWHYFAPVAGAYGANLPGAWDITTGAASVVVAVVDTGILNHADLAGRTVPGYDFINDSLIANDGNGRDNNPSDPGDWITSAESASGYFAGCPVSNSSWHGSHVAGTIAANSNNSAGVAGINWQAKILPVRVLGKCGGYTSDIVDGIRWAAGVSVSGVPANANPAKVINMSLGGSGACSSTYQNAINDAVNRGTVVAVAAGNSNANAANYTPASCANVITVASTGKAGNRAYYSNYGASVEIAAPGGDKNADAGATILSTLNTGTTTPAADDYRFYQGTSMATPHVAGIVSLMFSVNPNLTPAQVTSLLQSNVTPFPAGSTCTTSNCGAGIINAAAVVAAANAAASQPPAAFGKSSPTNGGSVQGTSTTLTWAASVGAASYEYCYDTTNDNACAVWTNNGAATSATASGLAAGSTYWWQVRALNANGATIANGGTWWSFGVQAATAPGAFNKSSPNNNSTNVSRSPTLRWNASSGATSYEYCYDTTNNNTCDGSWVSTGTARQKSLSGLQARTAFYWQVRAVNAGGATLANGGTWWKFTTR